MSSLKSKILNYLEGKDFVHSGEIERFGLELGKKASNAGRRCRELENEGKIIKQLNSKGEVLYKIIIDPTLKYGFKQTESSPKGTNGSLYHSEPKPASNPAAEAKIEDKMTIQELTDKAVKLLSKCKFGDTRFKDADHEITLSKKAIREEDKIRHLKQALFIINN